MGAVVLWERLTMWKEPGGSHYVSFLKRGDIIEIAEGYSYSERPWKDKRFIKVYGNGAVGFVLASAIKIKENSNEKNRTDSADPSNEEDSSIQVHS